ncbi:hypothetical protein M0805_009285 [Coniferiporia weirii]|nr:hypothetical protein M0805_009285 [Coniferiporia weirii]
MQPQDVVLNGNVLSQNASMAAADISSDTGCLLNGRDASLMNGHIGSPKLPSEVLSNATALLNQLKQDIERERNLAPPQTRCIPEAEKMRFNAILENIHKSLTEMDKVMPIYFSYTNEYKFVRGILNMLDLVGRQRSLLQSPTPTYVLDLPIVEKLHSCVTEVRGRVYSIFLQIAMQRADA